MKKFLKVIVGLVVALGIGAACGQADSTSGLAQRTASKGERLTQLTSGQLREILRGAGMRSVPPTQFSEGFACDGTWTAGGYRAPLHGRYSIRDNQYCMEYGGSRRCRQLFRSETGRLFGYVGVGGLTEIEISRVAACPE